MTQDLVSKASPTHLFYGGTFDPPHRGHSLVVAECLKLLPEVTVALVPAESPAGAYGQHKTLKTSFADRVNMLSLAFSSEIESQRVVLETIGATLPSPNYSYLTLEALTQKYPGSSWGILLGFDQLAQLPGWKEAERLLALYDLVAIKRPGFGEETQILRELSSVFGEIETLGPRHYRLSSGRNLFVLDEQVSSAQSRLIREAIDQATLDQWLDPNVTQYIREHRLYGVSEDI